MASAAMNLMSIVRLQDGLTFSEILDNLPTDPASLVVLALVAGAVALVAWGSRKKGGPSR